MPKKAGFIVQYVYVAGRRVRYLVAGEGEPLILVHGLSASTLWWIRNVPELVRHYRVYLVDLPGFGAMHFPRGRFVLANAASWLLSWMKAIDLERAHFIGHSMGGYICLWIAAHHPEKVCRLVLVAPSVKAHVRTVTAILCLCWSACATACPASSGSCALMLCVLVPSHSCAQRVT